MNQRIYNNQGHCNPFTFLGQWIQGARAQRYKAFTDNDI